MRPSPASPLSAISPAFGPTVSTPSASSVLRLRCVALLAHIAGFMAGASRIVLVGREQHGGRKIVRMAVRHLGHEVGGRGRDHDQIIVARETDVPDVEFAVLDRTGR